MSAERAPIGLGLYEIGLDERMYPPPVTRTRPGDEESEISVKKVTSSRPPKARAPAPRPINSVTPLPGEGPSPRVNLGCDRIPHDAEDESGVRMHKECLILEAAVQDDVDRARYEARLEVARERVRREDKVYCCGQLFRVPQITLIMRDVFLFTLVGLALGMSVDYAFTFIPLPPDNVAAFLALYLLQLNVNAMIIYGILQLYERIWYRSPDRYLGYSTFISTFYMSQVRFSLVSGKLITNLHPALNGSG